jgi:hypothetical protein
VNEENDRDRGIALLKAAGFAERVPPPRRKRDPAQADGFTAFSESDGSVLVCWMTAAGGNCDAPRQVAESRNMARAYAEAACAAGWSARLGGEIWHHARISKAA